MSGAIPTLVAAFCAALAAALAWSPRAAPLRAAPRGTPAPGTQPVASSVLVQHRLTVSLAAGLAGITIVGGVAGVLIAALVAVGVWTTIGRMEPVSVRQERELAARELPQVVQLLALVLASGASLPDSVRHVSRALPGPATAALCRAEERLAIGVSAEQVWADLATRPGFERVGRALARAHGSGAPVADVVRRLGEDLAREARAGAEDRARAVGVRAAVPLGICLLPAFLLIGIVPVVAASLRAIAW